MADATTSETNHPEDIELIEQLAKLQRLHRQTYELRKLLPTSLLEPVRTAIAKPQYTNPGLLAAQIRKAALKGRDDIQSFKKDWHDPHTRQSFKHANESNTPQGIDAWMVDYQDLVKAQKSAPNYSRLNNDIPLDSADEAKKALDDFQNAEHKIKLTPTSETHIFPLKVEFGMITFSVSRDESNSIYSVETTSSGEFGLLGQQVLDQLEHNCTLKTMKAVLEHFERYGDIWLQNCEKCGRLRSKAKYPVIRKKQSQHGSEKPEEKWLAYHKACLPLR